MEKLKLHIENPQETRNEQILRLIKFIYECVGGIDSNLSTKIANLNKIPSEKERKDVAEDVYRLFDTLFTKILKEYKLNKLPIKAYQIAERENIKSLFLEDQESEFIFLFPSDEDASISLNRILDTLIYC